MYTSSGLQLYHAPPVSEPQTAKTSVAIHPNAPITNYAEDLQTRLEVVSKLRVPHNEVHRAYGEFVKKLNDMCYETIAEQLVRSRPVSVAESIHSVHLRNIRPESRRTVKKSDNGSNSTIYRLYKAAEGVQKHLSTISESSHGEGLILPIKQANGRRNRSKITVDRDECLRSMDNTMDHFRSNDVLKCRSSGKIISTKKLKEKIEGSSVEMIETEFNITKDSLRNGNLVTREQKRRITAIRTDTSSHKHRQGKVDSRSVVSKTKKSGNETAQENFTRNKFKP